MELCLSIVQNQVFMYCHLHPKNLPLIYKCSSWTCLSVVVLYRCLLATYLSLMTNVLLWGVPFSADLSPWNELAGLFPGIQQHCDSFLEQSWLVWLTISLHTRNWQMIDKDKDICSVSDLNQGCNSMMTLSCPYFRLLLVPVIMFGFRFYCAFLNTCIVCQFFSVLGCIS